MNQIIYLLASPPFSAVCLLRQKMRAIQQREREKQSGPASRWTLGAQRCRTAAAAGLSWQGMASSIPEDLTCTIMTRLHPGLMKVGYKAIYCSHLSALIP